MILLTNDDGIDADGLKKLLVEVRKISSVMVVAPNKECSGCSHSISLARKSTPKEVSPENGCRRFVVEGTPSDCVSAAFEHFGIEQFSVVVSGINPGANVGLDIYYSGTVAGAVESALLGVPGIAISIDCPRSTRAPAHYETAAKYAVDFAKLFLQMEKRLPLALNINVPDVAQSHIRGLLYTVQSLRETEEKYPDDVLRDIFSPDRQKYPTDKEALLAKMVSVTPLGLDFTSYGMLKVIEEWTGKVWARKES